MGFRLLWGSTPLLRRPDFHFAFEYVVLGIGFSIPSLSAEYGVGDIDLLVSPIIESSGGLVAEEIG